MLRSVWLRGANACVDSDYSLQQLSSITFVSEKVLPYLYSRRVLSSPSTLQRAFCTCRCYPTPTRPPRFEELLISIVMTHDAHMCERCSLGRVESPSQSDVVWRVLV